METSSFQEKLAEALADTDIEKLKNTRPISPRIHRWVDLAMAGAFLAVSAFSKGGARTAALVNGSAMLGASLLTDYEGDGSRPISFEFHRMIDQGQAMLAGASPLLFGFGDEPVASFFVGQAGAESAVIRFTDWEAPTRKQKLRNAA